MGRLVSNRYMVSLLFLTKSLLRRWSKAAAAPRGWYPRVPPPVRRSGVAAWLAARRAVRSGAFLGEYLAFRLRTYCDRMPQDSHGLPWNVSVERNQIAVSPNPDAGEHPLRHLQHDPAVEAGAAEKSTDTQVRWLRALCSSEADSLARELTETECEVRLLTSWVRATEDTLRDLEQELRDDVTSGRAVVPVTAGRTARMRVAATYAAWLPPVCSVVALVLVLCEAYQFAIPYWNSIGVDTSNILAEWTRNPIGVLAGGGFSVAAAGSIFLLVHWLFDVVAALYNGNQPWRRALLEGAGAFGLACLLTATAAGIAAQRHGAGEASSGLLASIRGGAVDAASSEQVFLLLTLLVPLGVAYMHHAVTPIREERRRKVAAMRDVSAKVEEQRQARERREEVLRLLQAEREQLSASRDDARARMQKMQRRVSDAELEVRRQIECERRRALAYVTSLVVALERDRFAFLQEARRRGEDRLLGVPSADLTGNLRWNVSDAAERLSRQELSENGWAHVPSRVS